MSYKCLRGMPENILVMHKFQQGGSSLQGAGAGRGRVLRQVHAGVQLLRPPGN